MRQLSPIAKAPCHIFFLILAISGCSHSNPSLNQDNIFDRQTSAIVSIRNPDFVIKPPVTFSWLPESTQVFEDPRSKELPIQEIFRKGIAESLTSRGYEPQPSTSGWKSGSSSSHKSEDIGPKDLILVKDWQWAGPSFGAGGILKGITLDNRSKQDFTDLKIRIDYLGTKGPKEGYGGPTSIFVIHDTLPAGGVKTFKDINIGFRHPDERGERLRIINAKTITSDLLIGFTLALESPLSDHEISQTYGIAQGLASDQDKTNKYEKGTIIIDVADAQTRTLIWRGALQALVTSDIPEELRRERIDRAVRMLMEDFIQSNK